MLADETAIYLLGHMSATSRLPEHELTAFWAPFLLIHLGRKDNITAYAIEDNRLWLRHLQTFAVQVAAAAYILYESSIVGSRSLLRWATIIMFVVGVVKYGERVWAVRCANSRGQTGKNYRRFLPDKWAIGWNLDADTGPQDTEALLLLAYSTVDVSDELLRGPQEAFQLSMLNPRSLCEQDLYKVVEMQLSLIHDAFYTKAEALQSFCGVCIRIALPVATASSFFLFHLWRRQQLEGHSTVDVAVTYVLLVGALVMEMASALRCIFSVWIYGGILYGGVSMCYSLAHAVISLRRLVHAADWRPCWSRSMAQLELLKLCADSRTSRWSKISKKMKVEDWWNMLAYSWTIHVPASVEQLLLKQILESTGTSTSSPDHITNSRGRVALESWGLHESLAWSVDPKLSLEESILLWHIATEVYLCHWDKQERAKDTTSISEKVSEATHALSNYMPFLLAARPFLLSPTANHNGYVETCYGLTGVSCSSAEELASILHCHGDALNTSLILVCLFFLIVL